MPSESKSSSWFGTFSEKKLSQDFSYWIEAQVRYSFESGGTQQILYRTGLLQNLNESQGLGYLYAYIQSSALKEHRLTLQHTLKMNSFFSHRARFEMRLMEDDLDNATRFRYLLRGQKPIKNAYKLVAWNELFLNMQKTSWNGDRFFERNRLFLGLRKDLMNFSLEAGYLNQMVPRKSGDVSEHIAVVYLFF